MCPLKDPNFEFSQGTNCKHMQKDTLNQVQAKYNTIPMQKTEEKDTKSQEIGKNGSKQGLRTP